MMFLISTITTVEHHFSSDDNVEEMETYLTESKFNCVSILIYYMHLYNSERKSSENACAISDSECKNFVHFSCYYFIFI